MKKNKAKDFVKKRKYLTNVSPEQLELFGDNRMEETKKQKKAINKNTEERKKHGSGPMDRYDFGTYIETIIAKGLKKFLEESKDTGYPGDFTEKEWHKAVKRLYKKFTIIAHLAYEFNLEETSVTECGMNIDELREEAFTELGKINPRLWW